MTTTPSAEQAIRFRLDFLDDTDLDNPETLDREAAALVVVVRPYIEAKVLDRVAAEVEAADRNGLLLMPANLRRRAAVLRGDPCGVRYGADGPTCVKPLDHHLGPETDWKRHLHSSGTWKWPVETEATS